MRMWAIGMAATLLLAQQAPAASGCADLSSQPVNAGVQWNEVWSALDQQSSCTQNCHLGSNPAGDLDLSSRNLAIYFLVGQASSQDSRLARVEPGNPLASLFYQKLGCSHPDVGERMPPGASGFPVALQALVWDWIAQGAPGENPEDPIPREFVLELPQDRSACIADGRNGRVRTSSLYCLLELDGPLEP